MARSDSLSSTLSNDDDLKFILAADKNRNNGNDNDNGEDISEDSVNEVHEILIKDDQIRKQWNTGEIPQFPNYHGMDTTRLTARLKAKEKLLDEKHLSWPNLFKVCEKITDNQTMNQELIYVHTIIGKNLILFVIH